MQAIDKKSCSCEDKKVEKIPCDCGGQCGPYSSRSTESLEARKERLEKELEEVNQELNT
ncbi:hypothetical protein M1512_01195 [Patescibacteria group bacterium]|nr:hypothetical protein [Patescibacteria group bacterium]